MAEAPFVINPDLTGIAVAYQNRELIADTVLPRVMPVGTHSFKFTRYPIGDVFTIPDTRVGRRGAPNVVEFGGTQDSASTTDYGLEDEIPQDDIDQAANAQQRNPALPSPQQHSTEMLSNLIALDREVRVANLVFNANTYGASNKIALSGSSQFSDPSSDPVGFISDTLESLVMRPNMLTIGSQAWTALRRHPKLVKAVNKTAGDSGLISKADFAEMFELPGGVQVGGAFLNIAKPGQAATLARAWGKHMLFSRIDPMADRTRGLTFGMTVPYGTRVAGDQPDSRIGLRGGVRVRVGESVCELITAPDAAYFIQNAVG